MEELSFKEASYISAPYYLNFYKDVEMKSSETNHLFKLNEEPIHIDELRKVYIQNEGLNPLDFADNMEYDLSEEEFYQRLYNE